jgi:hypothetical protein
VNFTICFDEETGRQLNLVAKQAGETPDALICQAVREWLSQHRKLDWPDEVMAHKGIGGVSAFESGRWMLRPPAADPVA